MKVINRGVVTIHELHKLGFEIALDDFGVGYSSLSYLKRFPISSLKIDRLFIVDAPINTDGAALVKAIVAMAEVLGLSVVAEGVETVEYSIYKKTYPVRLFKVTIFINLCQLLKLRSYF